MTRLKHERRVRQLTQVSLAALAKIPQPTISQIERGRLVPSDDQLARLSAFFNVPADDLLKEVVVVEVTR